MNGDHPEPESARHGRRVRAVAAGFIRWIALLAVVVVLGGCVGDIHMSFLDPQGPVASAEAMHFYVVLGIMAVFVAGPIFLALPWLVWHYRYSNKAPPYTPKWADSKLIIAMSWGGPVLIVCVLGYFVWRDSHALSPYRPIASDQPALQVQVIGYDWKWLFIYPKQGIATVGTMALPVGRPVSLHLTSATVMQSFFIPALGSQIYAMGGMVTKLHLQANKPGRYLGENTMYDGNGFHAQKFTAIGMRPADFKKWVRQVRFNGVPINAHIFQMIGQRTTRKQMAQKLSHITSRDGTLYLTHVSPQLFPALVRAIKKGTTPTLISTSRTQRNARVAAGGHAATDATRKGP